MIALGNVILRRVSGESTISLNPSIPIFKCSSRLIRCRALTILGEEAGEPVEPGEPGTLRYWRFPVLRFCRITWLGDWVNSFREAEEQRRLVSSKFMLIMLLSISILGFGDSACGLCDL